MRRFGVGSLLLTLAGCAAGWAVIAVLCLGVGSTGYGFPRGSDFSAGSDWAFRIERVFLASLVGACLAAAGVTYQAILRNPLADPYLLGTSTGASLAVYLWSLPFATSAALSSGASQQAFAFVGAVLAVGLVFLLSQRSGRLEPITLLLVGVIVNALNGSIFLLLFYLNLRSDVTRQMGGALRFLVGGMVGVLSPGQKWSAAICAAAGWLALLAMGGTLNVSMAGEAEAESLGVRIHRVRWIALTIASLVTAAAVAVSGPIGFVGLVCPHLGRLIVGPDQRRLLPVATAMGAALLAIADAASSRLDQLPVGVLTALLGGPFFLFLLWQNRSRVAAI